MHWKKLKTEKLLLKHCKIGLGEAAAAVVVVNAPVAVAVGTLEFVMVSGLFVVTGIDTILLQLSALLQQK